MSQASSADGPPAASRSDESRRRFIHGSSLLLAGALPVGGLTVVGPAVAASVSSSEATFAAATVVPSDPPREIRLGLVGCGKRGAAVVNLLLAANEPSRYVRLTAMADAFPDRLQQTLRGLKSKYPQQVFVDGPSRCLGLDGYRCLLQRDVDLVLLATPPSFRPQHFEAAVAAGKHVYAEKPIAVDLCGVKRFQAANQRALAQGLVISVGLPRRFDPRYQATIARLQAGAIGQIISAQAVQTVRQGGSSAAGNSCATSHTEQELQLRNWTSHVWASGGPWVEPHVQNLDVINWLLGTHPSCAQPSSKETGDSDLLQGPAAVEFQYASGVVLTSHCRMVEASQPARLVLTVQGTSGSCDLAGGKIFDTSGRLTWRVGADEQGDDLTEQGDDLTEQGDGLPQRLLASIVSGASSNQGEEAVEATLTAILGRAASSRGQSVQWHELLAEQ